MSGPLRRGRGEGGRVKSRATKEKSVFFKPPPMASKFEMVVKASAVAWSQKNVFFCGLPNKFAKRS